LTDDDPSDATEDPHQHTVDALAAFGLVLEGPLANDASSSAVRSEYYLWTEHARPFTLFLNLVTQWRVSLGGPVGLEHDAVREVVARNAPAGHRRGAAQARNLLQSQLGAMERGALQGWSERRRERESKPS